MVTAAPTRERLLGARRTVRPDDDDDVRRLRQDDAGKIIGDDLIDQPRLQDRIASAGKVKRADVDRDAMSPPDALRYARWIANAAQIARRAEPGGAEVDDAGTLASAFSFLDDSRAGSALPHALLARLAAELGCDLAAVRIHTDAKAAKAAEALHARAFTIGSDVYFAAGAYDPNSDDGIALIAHEVAHVAQNLRGGAPTGGRRVSRPEDAHERQAEAFAARFRARRSNDPAELVNEVRRAGTRTTLPFLSELEQHFGIPLDFVETYTGDAAKLACEVMSASAFAIRNVVALADPSPQREKLMHELTHVVQMRGARAPTRFEIGTVNIGARGSAAEQEASDVSAHPSVSAAPDTIHRDEPTVDLKKALDSFKTKPAGRISEDNSAPADHGKCHYGVTKTGAFTSRLYKTSKVFDGNAFKAALATEQKDLKPTDLAKAVAQYGSTSKIAKIKGSSDQYIFFDDAETVTEVEDKSVTATWKKYKGAVDKLAVPAFKWPKGEDKWTSDDGAYGDTEEGKYREVMRDAISVLPRFCSGAGNWDKYYNEVVKSSPRLLDNRTIGDIFAKIVETSAVAAVDKNFSNWEAGDPIFDAALYGLDADKEARGDGTAFDGAKKAIICECKAKLGGPSAKEKKQARNYKKIITQQGKGYKLKGEDVEQHEFNHVIYAIADATPDKKIAMKWYQSLFVSPDDGGPIFTLAQASIVPRPDGAPEFKFKFNPEFTVALGTKDDPRTHFTLAKPAIGHPGLVFNTVDVTVDSTKSKVLSGSVIFDLHAGDIQQKNLTKTFTPAETGGVMATADGKMANLKSSLDKVLGPVKVDAAIVEDGIEATLDIQAGATKSIAGFQVDAIKLKAKYGTSGNLSVEGTVGLKHKNGKIAGSVTIGWSEAWSFSGTLTVKEGMIPGVSEFTCTVDYANGNAVIGVDAIKIEKKLKAVTLTGTGRNLKYDTKTGGFSGDATLDADLGMFGHASADATIADNELKKCTLNYDSPEFKYPAKSATPTFKGTVGGTVTYDNGKFSGAIRGAANLNVPALKAIAGDAGLGVAVDGHINADGSYGGTIKTLTALKFGKYFEIPSLSCTIADDGAVTGDFAIKIKNIKYLESAEIGCRIDKDGFKVVKADVHAAIGKPGDKMWGAIDVGYDETAGLKLTGTLNVKIKEGMVATGTLTYNSKTNAIDVVLTVDEITLFDFKKKQNLFKFSKQIPLVSFYNIIGIYLDLGLDLDFEFDMKLGLKPTISLDGLSFETWQYTKISAEIDLLGQLRAALVATPKVGLGLFAVSPSLLRGGGGIKVPITGEALLKPTGKLKVGYSPSGAVEGDASIGMQLTFGIKGAVKPYAEASVLDGAWNPSWTGDSLADFEILPPKELFNFTLDLAGDMSKKEPAIPTSPQPPSAPGGARQMPQEKPKTSEAGGGGPGKDATPPTTGPAGGAADDSVFKMASLTGALKGLPGYATISGFMEKAAKVWDKIKGFFSRVMKSFQSFFAAIGDAIEEVLNGFAAEGLGYLPKLIKKIVGDSTWEIIEPIINAAAGSAEAILGLFETDPPKNVGEFFTWGLKLMQKAFGIGFGSIGALISALHTMMTRLAGMAKKIVTKMVQDGMIGVKRHRYYYWAFGNHYFLAADEYKINVLGTNIYFRETGMLLDPNDVVGAGLFTALETMGVPATNMAVDDKTHDTYRDRWA